MDWIVGQWVPSKDPALFAEHYRKKIGAVNFPALHHPSNSESSPKLNWDKSDQEAKGIEASKEDQKTFKGVTVAEIQGLYKQDYTINEGADSISLQLKYTYNKTVAENSQKYTGSIINNLWLFNYFILNEKMAQTFFVPVTTCRYPNQVVRFRVFPDVEWEVSFVITTGETHTLKVGVKENLSSYPGKKGLKFSDKFKFESEYKGFSFGTDISVKANGDIHKFGFEKIENTIKALADLKQFLDKFDGNKSEKAKSESFTEYFSFKLVSPNIALAFKWNFDNVLINGTTNSVVPMLTGSLKLAPLIGVNFEVDLFIITDNIKVYGIGPITKFIRKSIEWVREIDIFLLAYIDIELLGEFSILYNGANGIDKTKSNNKAILNLPSGIKGGIKSDEDNVIILPSGETMEKFKAEISIDSGIKITEELGTDGKGPFKKNSYIFSGLSVKIIIIENVFSRQKLSIIPKIDETFEVLKEKPILPETIEYLNTSNEKE